MRQYKREGIKSEILYRFLINDDNYFTYSGIEMNNLSMVEQKQLIENIYDGVSDYKPDYMTHFFYSLFRIKSVINKRNQIQYPHHQQFNNSNSFENDGIDMTMIEIVDLFHKELSKIRNNNKKEIIKEYYDLNLGKKVYELEDGSFIEDGKKYQISNEKLDIVYNDFIDYIIYPEDRKNLERKKKLRNIIK